MRAVVYKKPFEVAVENVEDPKMDHANDVIVRAVSYTHLTLPTKA